MGNQMLETAKERYLRIMKEAQDESRELARMGNYDGAEKANDRAYSQIDKLRAIAPKG